MSFKLGVLWLCLSVVCILYMYTYSVYYYKPLKKVLINFTQGLLHKSNELRQEKYGFLYQLHNHKEKLFQVTSMENRKKLKQIKQGINYPLQNDTSMVLKKFGRTNWPNQEKGSTKHITVYNPSNFQQVRNIMKENYFEDCEVNNCEISFNRAKANVADAVIFDWRSMKHTRGSPYYKRPKGQVWIFIQHEVMWKHYNESGTFMRNKFNWTMTYSKKSDIYLPYGVIEPKPKNVYMKRDYLKIAQSKYRDALWVVSHCDAPSHRMEYVKILKQYIDIEILGHCGRKWRCGHRYNHESGNCFAILNSTYRYYLAFENNICTDYITEKFFENYDYDILQIVRGGDPQIRPINISKKAYICTSDFKDAHALGNYLQKLSQNPHEYARMLEEKDRYRLIHYRKLFKKSMCKVCKRLHSLQDYISAYDDMTKWIHTNEPCFIPNDI